MGVKFLFYLIKHREWGQSKIRDTFYIHNADLAQDLSRIFD